MRRIRTVTDWILYSNDGEHQRFQYNHIYGKVIYPVALNPLDDNRNCYYKFNYRSNRYAMIR